MSLAQYKKKRDFRATPEPTAGERRSGERRFVVQKHAATRLHYDFRLELGRTLKSWAIPKGLPMKKGEKRLAVQVEDHPLSYRTFEGTIPKGQYGGGTVMVWDVGTFTTEESRPLSALAAGKLHVRLRGTKLRGSWHLVRLRGEDDQWLIIRGEAEREPRGAAAKDRVPREASVLTGRTMAEIARGAPGRRKPERGKPERQKKGPRTSGAPARKATRQREKSAPGTAAGRTGKGRTGKARASAARAGEQGSSPSRRPKARAKSAKPLAPVVPMNALLVDAPPPGDWHYEIKFDGYRAVAYKDGDEVRLLSRNGIDLTDRFPEIAEALASADADRAIIDGEIVALDRKGRPSFQSLHRPEGPTGSIHFYAFDLMRADEEALTSKPLATRRARLERALAPCPDVIRFSAALDGDVETLLEKARALGLEGLIGKRADSTYEAGRRSGAWIKLKLSSEQELVIGGYTPPSGARSRFGALLLGVHSDGELRFAGKVGTGFDEATLRAVHARLQPLVRRTSPFGDYPDRASAASLAGVRWVEPELVCQVRFTEWTSAGRLRHPVFLGLREDKAPRDVVRERARPTRQRRRA